MRYGVLSDIHGNLAALRSTIAVLQREGVDAWLCAGDIVGYGPQPNECVETIAELDALCVTGNHELLVLGKLPTDRAGWLATETTAWTRRALRADCSAFLRALPYRAETAGIVLAHGSLKDVERYVDSEARGRAELRQLESMHPGARFLILGHTHRHWAFSEAGGTVSAAEGALVLPPLDRFILNPGAVGQSRYRERVPRARGMLLDAEKATARFYEVAYDVSESRAALRRHHLPYACIHLHPGTLPTQRRRWARLFRRLSGAAPIGWR